MLNLPSWRDSISTQENLQTIQGLLTAQKLMLRTNASQFVVLDNIFKKI